MKTCGAAVNVSRVTALRFTNLGAQCSPEHRCRGVLSYTTHRETRPVALPDPSSSPDFMIISGMGPADQ